MKKILPIILSAVLLLAVIGSCFPDSSESDNGSGTVSSGVGTEVENQSSTDSEEVIGGESSEGKEDGESSLPPTDVGSGKAEKIDFSTIPAYSGKPFVAINGNKPNFAAAELKTKGYEIYGALDSLGRCTTVSASLGRDTMPKEGEKRGDISKIKPSGWNQAQYDSVNGKYLYNRAHLIGWQLSAENANERNLITGTRYFNTEGMLPFENMVADYIKETGNHVAYRVTPIYNGNELVARGVQIEAYSIEDKGEGIEFNVFCYNVQPDIEINYSDGSSKLIAVPVTPPSQTTTPPAGNTEPPTNSQEQIVYVSRNNVYHTKKNCSGMKYYTEMTLSEAQQQNAKDCSKC